MIGKVKKWIKEYGIVYTVERLIEKLYTYFFIGYWNVNRKLTKRQRSEQESDSFSKNYCISIVVPLYNTPEIFLREMIESVLNQTYSNWQLCLADASDESHRYVKEICLQYIENETRIVYKKLPKNQGISENTNECLKMVTGEFVALLDHDDLLHPSALYEVAVCAEESQADLIYTDEATFLGKESRLLSVHRKPDFYMENLCANNYICHFTAFRKKLLEQTGGFRKEFDGSQDHDLIFRLCEVATKVCHIPKVLYFWRAHENSVALHTEAKEYVVQAGVKAIQAHLERMSLKGKVEVLPVDMLMYRVTYLCKWNADADVTVIYEESGWKKKLTHINTSFVLLLQPGIEMPSKETVQKLLMHMVKQEVVAVVPMVIGKNRKIVSAGVKWDVVKKRYINKYCGYSYKIPGYMNELLTATGTPAIVCGCMLVRKEWTDKMSLQKIKSGKGNCKMVLEPSAKVFFSLSFRKMQSKTKSNREEIEKQYQI